MHFKDRQTAGYRLAQLLYKDYRYEDCVVLALNQGGVLVGAQIAQQLCSPLLMLLIEEIFLPREPISVGGITSEGDFALNDELINDEYSELFQEYRSLIEEKKIEKINEMSSLIGDNLLAKKELIKYRNVIVVSDYLKGDLLLKLANNFLKPIKINQLIVAVPVADIKAVDWIHAQADKIYCLEVVDDTDFDANRYYDNNSIPSLDKIINIIQSIIINWQVD